MIAMYEPEGRVRGFQKNPSVVPDVEVRTNYIPQNNQWNILLGSLTRNTNSRFLKESIEYW